MSKPQKNESRFINRELSWIEFNRRVLEQAMNPDVPLLERVKFLAITASNLDEFFMVRVGSLLYAIKNNRNSVDPAGLSPTKQLEAIRDQILEFNELQESCLRDQLDPALAAEGIVRLSAEHLTEDRLSHLREIYEEQIKSTFSPIAISNVGDTPVLKGARLCLCARIRSNKENSADSFASFVRADEGQSIDGNAYERFVLIPLPVSLDRVVFLPSELGVEYIFIEEIAGLFLHELFPGEELLEWTTLRVTRNADFELDDDADDFLSEMKQFIDTRERSHCVRLRVAESTSDTMLNLLINALEIDKRNVYRASGPLDLSSLFSISGLSQFQDLRSADWPAVSVAELQKSPEFFDEIGRNDVMLLHPYQSFDPVVWFLEVAAADPQVIAIKQTLYRTSRNSRIVKALAAAAENGKHVTVIVELKARFDEERNLDWAEYLESAGVDVVYGVAGLKVHAKLAIVVRREVTGIRRYVHFGTGNYNESTASLYSDVSLLTSDPQLGIDAVHAFNAITGLSTPQDMEKLRIAPLNLRQTLVDLIQNEVQNAKAGGTAFIAAKFNSLVDPGIIDELYQASQAGVKIRLNVRGICCLRPGVPGLSDNIEVISVIDRFLEHSRILHFHHGGDNKVFITSADWMGRNLDRRVELLVPVQDEICKQALINCLDVYFSGNVNVWRIEQDGTHTRIEPGNAPAVRPQQVLYETICEKQESQRALSSLVFQPIRRKD
ncbi:MAG: polyphosphate kinase 1 [Pirellulaceae bacterium]